jgi:hypothetical protein
MRGTGGWLATAARIPGPRRWESWQHLKAGPVSPRRGEPLRVSIQEECEETVNQDSAWAAQRFQIWSHHRPDAGFHDVGSSAHRLVATRCCHSRGVRNYMFRSENPWDTVRMTASFRCELTESGPRSALRRRSSRLRRERLRASTALRGRLLRPTPCATEHDMWTVTLVKHGHLHPCAAPGRRISVHLL